MDWKDIETERLVLRRIRKSDAESIAEKLNDFEVSKSLARVPFPYTLEGAHWWINFLQTRDPQNRVCCIAFKAKPDEMIGVVSYETEQDREFPELGYWLGRQFWGQRIMSEAATALVKFAFESDGVAVLQSGYWNPVSGRLLRKLGFVETEIKKTHSLAQGKDMDSMQMLLTRERWITKQKGRAT